MSEQPSKPTSARRARAQHFNNHGPCPCGTCKHPPADHRPVAHSKAQFCYGPDCMTVCVPDQRVRLGARRR